MKQEKTNNSPERIEHLKQIFITEGKQGRLEQFLTNLKIYAFTKKDDVFLDSEAINKIDNCLKNGSDIPADLVEEIAIQTYMLLKAHSINDEH